MNWSGPRNSIRTCGSGLMNRTDTGAGGTGAWTALSGVTSGLLSGVACSMPAAGWAAGGVGVCPKSASVSAPLAGGAIAYSTGIAGRTSGAELSDCAVVDTPSLDDLPIAREIAWLHGAAREIVWLR